MEFIGSVTGISDLDKTFANLPKAMQRRVYIPALKKGAFLVRDMAVANLKAIIKPDGRSTGVLVRNIRVYQLKKYRGNYRVAVMVKRGLINDKVKGKPVRVGLYASVLEYGKQGQKPQSWIRKAIREASTTAPSVISSAFSLGMVAAVQEARK